MPDPERDPADQGPGAPTTDDLSGWRAMWEDAGRPPLPGGVAGGGIVARLKQAAKRAVRRLTVGSQHDLWERQRRYNLRLQQELETRPALDRRLDEAQARVAEVERELPRLGAELQQVQSELARDLRKAWQAQEQALKSVHSDLLNVRDQHLDYLQSHSERLEELENLRTLGFDDLRRHLDSLYSRLDLKIDEVGRRSRHLWSRLEALLAVVEDGRPAALAQTAGEQDYLALEHVFRGREEEIERRIEPYVEILEDRAPVLDLGCGRGEALSVLASRGIEARGVDSSSQMVAICREKGLEAEVGELFEVLKRLPEESLGAIVSFHVIEHLPAESLAGLVRLAWRALRPGGVLALETPSPLSLVVAATDFWIDPTHRRPVHPDSLRHTFERAGFDPVERLDLQPFAAERRLAEISRDGLAPEAARLAERVNRLRDQLDRLLYGFQDYGMVGFKPDPGAAPPPSEDRAAG